MEGVSLIYFTAFVLFFQYPKKQKISQNETQDFFRNLLQFGERYGIIKGEDRAISTQSVYFDANVSSKVPNSIK